MMRRREFLAVVFGIMLAGVVFTESQGGRAGISIATGNIEDSFYPVGGAICRFVNRTRRIHGIRCVAERSGGSRDNLRRLREGSADFGLARANEVFQAFTGRGDFARDKGYTKLRTVFKLDTATLTLVVGKNSGIKEISDLQTVAVGTGHVGSNTQSTLLEVMQVLKLNPTNIKQINLNRRDRAAALCDGKIEVAVFLVGHPNGSVKELLSDCGARIVSLSPAQIKRIRGAYPYYEKALIPANTYEQARGGVATIGIPTLLVTMEDNSSRTVFHLIQSVFNRAESFSRMHPYLEHLDRRSMIMRRDYPVALHDGAKRYLKEAGLL